VMTSDDVYNGMYIPEGHLTLSLFRTHTDTM